MEFFHFSHRNGAPGGQKWISKEKSIENIFHRVTYRLLILAWWTLLIVLEKHNNENATDRQYYHGDLKAFDSFLKYKKGQNYANQWAHIVYDGNKGQRDVLSDRIINDICHGALERAKNQRTYRLSINSVPDCPLQFLVDHCNLHNDSKNWPHS